MSDEPCLCGTDFTCLADTHGCYICQPDNPNAAEEGCEECDREYWDHVLRGVEDCQPHDWLDRPESDTRECLRCGAEVNG